VIAPAPGAAVRRLMRHGAYAPLLFVALGLMMARLLAAARILEVTEFAHYSAALLVSGSFCMLGSLGLQTMLQRELPVMIHRGEELRGMVLLTQSLVVAAACALVGLLAALVVPTTGAGQALDRSAFAVGVLHGLSQQVFVLVTVESRSRGRTMAFARQYMVRSVAVVAFGMLAMRLSASGTWGAAAEAAATLAISAWVLHGITGRTGTRIAAAAMLATRRLHDLRWRAAAALLAVFALSWAVQNADRWVAERALGVTSFAVYAFAANAVTVASAVQMVTNAALFPRLATVYASSGRRGAFASAMRFSVLLGALGLVAAPAAVLAWSYFIDRWFPLYVGSNAAAPLLIGVGVLRVSDYWSSFLLVVGAERRLLAVTAVTALVLGTAWWLLLPTGGAPTIESIAWLALALAAGTYGSSFLIAWRESRQ
jgi:O-antigen/teichoic acid export membrane protein